MTIAIERRDFLRRTACFVCNQQEAGILFSEDYGDLKPERNGPVSGKKDPVRPYSKDGDYHGK